MLRYLIFFFKAKQYLFLFVLLFSYNSYAQFNNYSNKTLLQSAVEGSEGVVRRLQDRPPVGVPVCAEDSDHRRLHAGPGPSELFDRPFIGSFTAAREVHLSHQGKEGWH